MSIRTLALAASALALSQPGAASARAAAVPQPSPAVSGPFVAAAGAPVAAGELPGQWWRLYDDPVLDTLVEDALRANTDVRQAVTRID
ncbi:hypothetical protein ABTM76_19230, partial [Acinetobacter baumannii]